MDRNIEQDIYRIISGKLLFTFNGKNYSVIPAKPIIKYEANIIYESIINDEKYSDWIRQDNLERYMIYLGVWNNEMSIFLEKTDKQIEDYKVSLFNNRLNTKMTQKTRNQLLLLRKRISELQQIKQSYYIQTLEGYAESIKYEYIMTHTVYSNNKKVFNQSSSQNSYNEFSAIINEINQHSLTVSDYRKIARSEIWRSFWSIDKNNIFRGTVTEWTEEQRMLAGYSSMYDSVYEHPERPIDNVIEDDDMLDGWMISKRREIEKTKQQDQILKSNNKLDKAQEVFIFTDSKEGAKEIMNMNSQESLLAIAQREHAIQKGQIIDHSSLPDVKKTLLNK